MPRLDDKIRVLITIFIRLNDQVSIKSASGSITATVAGKLEGPVNADYPLDSLLELREPK